MRRSLVALLTLLALGCLAGAVQALGVASLPLLAPAAKSSAARDRGAGVAVRSGRVVVDTTADRPDVKAGDGRCADARGRCSLRAAVMEANANSKLTRIVLPKRTYTLRLRGGGEDRARRGDLDIRRSLTVEGRGAHLRAGRRDRAFDVAPNVRLSVSNLTIVGGAPPAGESGGAIRSAGRLQLTGVKVAKNAVTGDGASGGGIFVAGGSALLRETQVNRNTAPAGGGAIAADGGTVLLRDSRLLVNTAGTGGALRLAVDAVADVRDSELERNRATGSGGGAIAVGGGRLTVLRGSLSGNEAAGAGNGGAIRNDGGDVIVEGGDLLRNGAGAAGGAVAAAGGSTTLSQVQLKDNAAANGGGLDLTGSARAAIRHAVVQGNRVAGSGGAVRLAAGTALDVTGGSYLIVNQAAGPGGGAIYNDGGRVTISGGTVSGNRATGGDGGALVNRAGSTAVEGADLSRNTTARAGGAVAVAGGTVTVSDGYVDENAATRGGGIHAGGGTVTIGGRRGSRVASNRASAQGGGLWVADGATVRATRTAMVSNRAPSGPRAWVAPGGRATRDGARLGGS